MLNLTRFQMLCDRLSPHARQALEHAVSLCRQRGHFEITLDHLLVKLLDDPRSDLPLLARSADIETGQWQALTLRGVDRLRTGNSGGVQWTADVLLTIERAWLITTLWQTPQIRSGAIFLAIMELREEAEIGFSAQAGDDGEAVLRKLGGLTREKIETVCGGSVESPRGAVLDGALSSDAADDSDRPAAGAQSAGEALDRFSVSLTALAAQGRIDRVTGRDEETRRVVEVLCRRRKNNAILVGEPGVGKTAIVEGLAMRLAGGLAPAMLRGCDLRSLDLAALQAGAGVKGEFEKRLKQLLGEVVASSMPIVLFIDEAHLLIGSGNQAGAGDAANLLKPALARGELRTVAATTWSEYKKYIETDAALGDRFELIHIDEPSEDRAIAMLRGTREAIEAHHQVRVLEKGVESAVRLSSRYLSGRQLPRKAVDLLDTAAARVRLGLIGQPPVIEDLENRIDVLKIEREAKLREQSAGVGDDAERLATIDGEIASARSDLAALTERWAREKEAASRYLDLLGRHPASNGQNDGQPEEPSDGHADRETRHPMAPPVDEDDGCGANAAAVAEALAALREVQGDNPLMPVHLDEHAAAQVIGDWTGIPVGRMVENDKAKLRNLEAQLRERVRGQDHALAHIAQTIRVSKAGMGNPDAPIGVFLLVGPSGTGKTETARALAELLFSDERFLLSLNMSEFKEEHTVSLLLGSPPGFVGYGEGGRLTEPVRQRPYSVVLLDEFEKAHRQVTQVFYQIFDRGFCEDRTGRRISFRNTIILLTSNLESERIVRLWSEDQAIDPDRLVEEIRPGVSAHFEAALAARMRIVPYFPLGRDVLTQVVSLKLSHVARRAMEAHGLDVTFDPAVAEALIARCEVTELGARQVDHAISDGLLPALASYVLAHGDGALRGMKVTVLPGDASGYVCEAREKVSL